MTYTYRNELPENVQIIIADYILGDYPITEVDQDDPEGFATFMQHEGLLPFTVDGRTVNANEVAAYVRGDADQQPA